MKYKTIYADPPWLYSDARTHKSAGMALSAYSCLPTDEICKLDISSLADVDCTLLLWATMPKLADALKVCGAWGFTYKTCAFVWVKLNPSGEGIYSGLGHWVNGNAELVLLANKGRPKRLVKNIKQIVMSPRGRHSAKPDEVRKRIVKLFEPPYLELFARNKISGWDCWGDEIESDININGR